MWIVSFPEGDMDKLEGHDDYRIDGCLRVIKSLNDEINTVSKRILLLAKEDEIAKLLMMIPGIGYYYSALLIVVPAQIGYIINYLHGLHFFCLVLVCVLDVINLCRNISDGVRPFMPPCSLVSLYALTNLSYLCLPSSMFGIYSNAMNSLFTILLYASTFPCNCG